LPTFPVPSETAIDAGKIQAQGRFVCEHARKFRRRRLRLGLLTVLLFLTLPIIAFAQFTWTTNDGTIAITGYTGPGGDVTIPSEITGLPVTAIGPNAFNGRTDVTGITLPETLTSVGDWAFRGCGLTRLALPNSLTNIQDASYVSIGGPFGVFNWCTSLTNVIFGKDLAYLGTGAFTFCENLTTVFFQGNAPATVGTNGGPIPGPWIFLNAPLVTVYYLPGTTGWEPTFSQRPTMLWNPQIQTGDSSFGVGPNGFGFNVTGTPDIPLVIEAGTSLAAHSWVSLQSCTLTNGLINFRDAYWTNYPGRFYRLRSP